MSNELQVALASDAVYFPGLLVAATSVAFFADRSRRLTLLILDGGLPERAWQRLTGTVSRVNPRATCVRLPVSKNDLGRPAGHGLKGPMVYARLLLPDRVAAGRVIYIDCDFLVLTDLSRLHDMPMGGALVLAARDSMVRALADDCPRNLPAGVDRDAPYFNSGLLVFDAQAWREASVAPRAFKILEEDGARCTYWDQTALNFALAGRVGLLDRGWNFPNRGFAVEQAGTEVSAIHYVDRNKPWLHGCGNEAHALWRAFARTVVGVDSHELGWRVRWDEMRDALRSRNASLLAMWFAAQVRCGRSDAVFPAAYWREAAPRARIRRPIVRRSLAHLERGWTAQLVHQRRPL